MIDIKTGKFGLADHEMIIHPDLTVADFENSGIPVSYKYSDSSLGYWINFHFNAQIEDLKADFMLQFRCKSAYMLMWRPLGGEDGQDWDAVSGYAQERFLSKWLAKVIGRPPPYEYNWGTISSHRDTKDGIFSIIALYNYDIASEIGEKRLYEAPAELTVQRHPKPQGLPPGFKPKD